jgi:hypothetical protein
MSPEDLAVFFSAKARPRALADIKGIYDNKKFMAPEWAYWRL